MTAEFREHLQSVRDTLDAEGTQRRDTRQPRVVSGASSVWSVEAWEDIERAGYLPGWRQRGWRRLIRHVLLRAILDAAGNFDHSGDEAQAFLTDPANAKLFAYARVPQSGTAAHFEGEGHAERLQEAARHVVAYLSAEGQHLHYKSDRTPRRTYPPRSPRLQVLRGGRGDGDVSERAAA